MNSSFVLEMLKDYQRRRTPCVLVLKSAGRLSGTVIEIDPERMEVVLRKNIVESSVRGKERLSISDIVNVAEDEGEFRK